MASVYGKIRWFYNFSVVRQTINLNFSIHKCGPKAQIIGKIIRFVYAYNNLNERRKEEKKEPTKKSCARHNFTVRWTYQAVILMFVIHIIPIHFLLHYIIIIYQNRYHYYCDCCCSCTYSVIEWNWIFPIEKLPTIYTVQCDLILRSILRGIIKNINSNCWCGKYFTSFLELWIHYISHSAQWTRKLSGKSEILETIHAHLFNNLAEHSWWLIILLINYTFINAGRGGMKSNQNTNWNAVNGLHALDYHVYWEIKVLHNTQIDRVVPVIGSIRISKY